jgi:hypothetical protein
MSKFCVFCGERPVDKSDEHIIPMWLIELTGDPKRDAHFGIDLKKGSARSFSFDQFKFPACSECNAHFSELEGMAKKAVLRILKRRVIFAEHLEILLDWLDKVRVWLWLAGQYLNKDFIAIDRNFYISKRMGAYDRTLHICYIKSKTTGVAFVGTHFPVFYFNPVCFGIRINDVLISNFSSAMINARNMGFPHVEISAVEKKHVEGKVVKGSGSVKTPINALPRIRGSLCAHQAILNKGMDTFVMTPEEAAIDGRILHSNEGSSKILLEGSGGVAWLNRGDVVKLSGIRTIEEKFFSLWYKNLVRFSIQRMEDLLVSGLVSDEEMRELYKTSIALSQELLAVVREGSKAG